MKLWTKDEVRMLQRWYAYVGAYAVPWRPAKAVNEKARRLGLRYSAGRARHAKRHGLMRSPKQSIDAFLYGVKR